MKRSLPKFVFVLLLGLLTIGCSKSEKNPQAAASSTPSQAVAANPSIETLPSADKNTPIESYVEIKDGAQLRWIYYSQTSNPINYEDIAGEYSDEYHRTVDGFKKKDILDKIKPNIDAEIAKAKKVRYVLIENNASLDPYNFEKKSFFTNSQLFAGMVMQPNKDPQPFASAGFYDSHISYYFINGDQYRYLKVEDADKARQIEGARGKLKLVAYAYVQAATPFGIGLQVVKVKLTDGKGLDVFIQQ